MSKTYENQNISPSTSAKSLMRKIQKILYALDLKASETDPDIALEIDGDRTF
ncbi:MAG TPA: hypothetical protein VFV86_07760 [Nitrososphaeraceae archaeon]|nr:hypothetical protein [Nitrososphaeraceae archaeon]